MAAKTQTALAATEGLKRTVHGRPPRNFRPAMPNVKLRGVPFTDGERSPKTWIITKLQNRQEAARPFERHVRLSSTPQLEPARTKKLKHAPNATETLNLRLASCAAHKHRTKTTQATPRMTQTHPRKSPKLNRPENTTAEPLNRRTEA